MTKRTAWQWFSKYIRLRDCYRTTGTSDMLRCVTCNKLVEFKDAHAGHAIGGRSNGILFDDEIVHGQCVTCNYFKKGNYEMYIPKLIEKYGTGWYLVKCRNANTPCKLDFAEEAKKWKQKYKKLKGEQNGH